nr:integrase, catalytic region, zinc finger, CCHC-type, peptidase aspartic, catalytic [Tanacetum cinerariifolium]
MQTQTSNALHNAIMEAGSKDRPPMLASEGSSETTTKGYMENYKNVLQDMRDQFNVESEAVQIILTGIDNDIYSTVDACPNACKMNQCDVINHQVNVQFLLQLQPEWQSRANQDNSPRINRGTGYENQRVVNVAGAKENVVTQELEAHYMYMTQIQEVTPATADNSGPIFDAEPLQKIQNYDDNYNVFDDDQENPEQPESVNEPYPNMCYDREHDDQDDTDELAQEHNLLASLIEKLKCEIDDSKNRNKFLETSNKALGGDKLKGEIQDFKTKNKNLESTNNHFKEANNKLSKTNQLMFEDLKKFQAELDRYHDVNYASKVATDCAKAKGDLISYKMKSEKTKQPIDVSISTKEPKRTINQSAATPLKRTVASDSTNQKPRHTTRKLYEHVSKTCSWWYPKFTPSGYKWKPKSLIGNVNTNFGNDQIASILGYGDLVQEKVTIKRFYYVEGLNHNLFSIGQFCDSDLEVAFRKSTCYIRDLKGNDLLTGSRGTDLYSVTLQETFTPNPICLMAKATSSQAWLWHHRLSHLNFDTINLLSKNNIVTGLPKLKFIKYHLCSSCIRHETSTARTPKQNGIVERRNHTLVEAARTMLSAAKVPLFFWAEAIATACFTQNRALVITRHEKTPYHIINGRKPFVKFFHIFGSLSYIVRDGENLDKMKEKCDACIFVGYL